MKFPLSWLKAPLETDADAETIAETLTRIGLEVEHVDDKAKALSAFIVAEVLEAASHPKADRLRVTKVNTGKEILQVVCGAPNARAGIKVVLAPPGTYVPGLDVTLKATKIRGVDSLGMLCSASELQLSDAHDGIIELAADAVVGSNAAQALGLNDPVFDVALTPNRGDCASVYGIARDLAAAGLGRLREGDLSPVKGAFSSPIKIELTFPAGFENAAPMFAGRLIRGVKNGPSPQWLQDWLKAVGLRPISALVDVTNFISLDRGRPLHVFDAKKLKGNLRARFAKEGETLTALDGKSYTLDSQMVVIADDEKARGIAGVMGGEDSSCDENTTDVFIESALFDPVLVARAGRTLGILSDARYRFERGVDPEFVLPGLELATKMILNFCGGEPSDIVVAGGVPKWKRVIAFHPSSVKKLAGLDMPTPDIMRILMHLHFAVEPGAPMHVTPPSWRSDIVGEADLVEEVVRIHGLDAVPAAPMRRPDAVARAVLTAAQRRVTIARRALAARGFDETVHFSFLARDRAKLFGGGDEARQLANPIASDLDALRPSVLPSLLAAASRNQARGIANVTLFEIGAQFASGKPGDQTTMACGLRVGAPPRHWSKGGVTPDAMAAKADCLAALETASGAALNMPAQAAAPAWYHPARSGALMLGQKPLAFFGEVHPRILAALDVKGPACAFEIFLDAIPDAKAKPTKARAKLDLPDLPAVERDFAFVVDASVSAEQILKAAKGAERNLIDTISVFDVYEGKGIPEGKKSIAIAVRLQPREKTLTDAEIDAVAAAIVAAVTKATGGTLRS
jgi:phenylalanyl-tRNA synthetase beta chain